MIHVPPILFRFRTQCNQRMRRAGADPFPLVRHGRHDSSSMPRHHHGGDGGDDPRNPSSPPSSPPCWQGLASWGDDGDDENADSPHHLGMGMGTILPFPISHFWVKGTKPSSPSSPPCRKPYKTRHSGGDDGG